VDHEEFHDPEFVAMVKHLSLSIDMQDSRRPTPWRKWDGFFLRMFVTLNCPHYYESKLCKHPVMKGVDVVVKPDRVILTFRFGFCCHGMMQRMLRLLFLFLSVFVAQFCFAFFAIVADLFVVVVGGGGGFCSFLFV
jgi:hypothetical protein